MVYFISDIHLGAACAGDRRAHERRVVEFLRSIRRDATEIYLLGDILDYWYEYRHVVPRGYVRFFGALAELADAGVKITWMTGNHDIWLFDYLRDELGVEVVDAPLIERTIAGKRFLLGHGDRIGHNSFGFRLICKAFRNKFCQKLYAAIHPRWTVPFASGWSQHSRSNAVMMPHEEHGDRIVDGVMAIDRLADRADYVVIGHHHVMMHQQLPGIATELVCLGDWIWHDSYGVFDGTKFDLRVFKS